MSDTLVECNKCEGSGGSWHKGENWEDCSYCEGNGAWWVKEEAKVSDIALNVYEVYGKPNCPYCEKAKNLLDSKKLGYVYKDVTSDSQALGEMTFKVTKNLGAPPRTVPQIFKGDLYIGGFDKLQDSFKGAIVENENFDDLEDF